MKSLLFNAVLSLCMLLGLSCCSDLAPYNYFAKGRLPALNELPPKSAVKQRLLLIGDAGWPRSPEPVLRALTQTAKLAPDKTRIVFLGDNIYLDGMAPPGSKDRAATEARLKPQMDVALISKARTTFLPGNHDHHHGNLPHQHEYIKANGAGLVDSMPPSPQDPGPSVVDLPGMRLIFLDTALMLNEPEKYLRSPSPEWCSMLKQQIAFAGSRKVMVMAHHPVATNGSHGGFADGTDHLFPLREFAPLGAMRWFPLPGLGTLYNLYHRTGWDSSDLRSPVYQQLIAHLENAFAAQTPCAYVAGHDHDLQVLEHWIRARETSKPLLQIVSGAGSQTMLTAVTHRHDTLFSHHHTGFMVIDVTKRDEVWLSCVEPANRAGESKVVFSWQFPIRKVSF